MTSFLLALITIFSSLLICNAAYAYIGPGAGFALVGSSAVFIIAIVLGFFAILFLPVRLVWRAIKHRGRLKAARLRRLIILGFDGMDPRITDAMLAAGELPALQRLRDVGGYWRLKSTIPSMSPVAWSSFQTGVNPGSHNVFDFLTRDKRTYLPGMVSVETGSKIRRRFFRKYKVEEPVLTRKSKPFWKILGDNGVFSTILRVPISYPPEPLRGNILSAMCTPDLRGSQGSFMYFSSDQGQVHAATSGEFKLFERVGDRFSGRIRGPELNGSESEVSFTLEKLDSDRAVLQIDTTKTILNLNVYSSWVKLSFHGGSQQVSGIARFLLRSLEPCVSLYVSPVNVDPEAPALPISSPGVFSRWLAGNIGDFGSLGFLEDTWGRNEHATDDQSFLDQLFLNQREREAMLDEVLKKVHRGLCVCVFDGTDRVQHMFWRYREANHPAPKEDKNKFSRAIEDVYAAMDKVVEKVMAQKRAGDEVLVLSDHGFGSFRRCVNLNRWLLDQGYLVLKEGTSGAGEYLVDVDWSKTRAFALGITGIYINRKGRESKGIVESKDVMPLAREIASKLEALRDPKDDTQAIKKVYLAKEVYKGLYADEAPDLIMGYRDGYRVSWESVTGSIEAETFSDNVKAWSGDHHIYPDDVKGVLFSSMKMKAEEASLLDLAPTALELFGVKAPGYMEGRSLL